MRNKKIFYFNEEKIAEDTIRNGFETKEIDYNLMYLVAKYFREKEKLGEIRLERKVIEFCKQHNPHFNPVLEREQIKHWVKSALKYDLRKIREINITQKEINFLKKIVSNRDRKLLFTMLVFAKGLKKGNTRRGKTKFKKSEKYYIRYNNFLDIVRLSKLTNITESKFAKILYKYKDYFTFYTPEKELIRIDFAESNLQTEDLITLDNLDSLPEHYIDIFGKNMTYCSICGKEIHKRGRNQKYCEECAKDIRNEQQKELMRKRRDS